MKLQEELQEEDRQEELQEELQVEDQQEDQSLSLVPPLLQEEEWVRKVVDLINDLQ